MDPKLERIFKYGLIALMVVLVMAAVYLIVTSSGYSNQAINMRANLGLNKKPSYHDMEGATAIEYGLNRAISGANILKGMPKFEGLRTTRRVVDPWRKVNPYVMMR
jgi:hypothetical protein